MIQQEKIKNNSSHAKAETMIFFFSLIMFFFVFSILAVILMNPDPYLAMGAYTLF